MAYKDEGGSHGSLAAGFCMIDPVVLNGVINDLATMESAITTELNGLKTEFEKVGASTGPITNLVNVAAWLQGELPMLRRRHAAAVLLESQGLQFSPGTHLLTMPENPDDATKQAAGLAVTQVRNGLDGKPPGRDGVNNAIRAIERIRTTTGRLSPDDLLFLETFYRDLGKDVYRLPDYLTKDGNGTDATRAAATVVGGLLTLSQEGRGGGWNRLPKFIQEAASDRFEEYIYEGSGAGEKSGGKARELAGFLAHAGGEDQAGWAFSKRLAITAAQTVQEYLKNDRFAPGGHEDEVPRIFLRIAGRSESAMHDLLTGKNMVPPAGADKDLYDGYTDPAGFLVPISTYAWSDDGKAAATVYDWIADARRSHDLGRTAMAKETMQSLVTTLTRPDVAGKLMDIDGVNRWSTQDDFGTVNPELARSLARDASAFLREFSDPGAPDFVTTGTGMSDGEEVTARLFTLVATDRTAAEALAGSIYRHNIDGIHDALTRPTNESFDPAVRAGQLQGLLDSALHNVAIERTGDKDQAKQAADEIRGQALSVVGFALDKAKVPGTPDGVGPVDIADAILGRVVTIDTEPVEPQQINPQGVDVRAYSGDELLVRYDFTKALVETGRLKPEDLPDYIRADGEPPRLKSPAEFTPDEYNTVVTQYSNTTDKVPGATAVQKEYLNHYHRIYGKAITERQASTRDELQGKVGIG